MRKTIFLFALAFLFYSVNALADKFDTIKELTYKAPSSETWTAEKETYENVTLINWASKTSPKKEMSIVVEETDAIDIHSLEFMQKLTSVMPPSTDFSEPSFTDDHGHKAMVMDFNLFIHNRALHGKIIAAIDGNHFYQIIVSKYSGSIEEDSELMDLIKFIKIQ